MKNPICPAPLFQRFAECEGDLKEGLGCSPRWRREAWGARRPHGPTSPTGGYSGYEHSKTQEACRTGRRKSLGSMQRRHKPLPASLEETEGHREGRSRWGGEEAKGSKGRKGGAVPGRGGCWSTRPHALCKSGCRVSLRVTLRPRACFAPADAEGGTVGHRIGRRPVLEC